MTKAGTKTAADSKKDGEGFVAVDVQVPVSKTVPDRKVLVRRRQAVGLNRSQLCLRGVIVVLAVAAVAMAALGAYYVYKSLHHTKYSGRCGVGLKSGTSSSQYLDENVEISDDRETIEVPKFDDNDQATFIHDFAQKVSIIKDVTQKVCYLLPLDTNLIPPPQDFLDIIYGIADGKYIYDADKIRSEYKVVRPEIDEKHLEEEYGTYIAKSCSPFKTFRLEQLDLPMTTTTTLSYIVHRRYIMYPGGHAVIQYYIYE